MRSSAVPSTIFDGEGMRVIRTPIQAPNANAHIERWVGSVRRECLVRLLIFSRRQLERVLRVYVRHYKRAAPAPGARPTRARPIRDALNARRPCVRDGAPTR